MTRSTALKCLVSFITIEFLLTSDLNLIMNYVSLPVFSKSTHAQFCRTVRYDLVASTQWNVYHYSLSNTTFFFLKDNIFTKSYIWKSVSLEWCNVLNLSYALPLCPFELVSWKSGTLWAHRLCLSAYELRSAGRSIGEILKHPVLPLMGGQCMYIDWPLLYELQPER